MMDVLEDLDLTVLDDLEPSQPCSSHHVGVPPEADWVLRCRACSNLSFMCDPHWQQLCEVMRINETVADLLGMRHEITCRRCGKSAPTVAQAIDAWRRR
jgi:hypothetical protein